MNEIDPNSTGKFKFDAFQDFMTRGDEVDAQEEELLQAFRDFDEFNKGLISAPEIRRKLSVMGEKLKIEEVEEMISKVDKDGDNQINYEEFKKMMTEWPNLYQ